MSELDYKAMWNRLTDEVRNLRREDVKAVDPNVILGYMQFIEEVERANPH